MSHDIFAFTSRAQLATPTPERYAKQLVGHLGRKLEFRTAGATSTAAIGDATVRERSLSRPGYDPRFGVTRPPSA